MEGTEEQVLGRMVLDGAHALGNDLGNAALGLLGLLGKQVAGMIAAERERILKLAEPEIIEVHAKGIRCPRHSRQGRACFYQDGLPCACRMEAEPYVDRLRRRAQPRAGE